MRVMVLLEGCRSCCKMLAQLCGKFLYGPPPSAQYLERTRHSTVLPLQGAHLWGLSWRKTGRNLVLALAALVVGGSIAGVFYTRSIAAEERRFEAGVSAIRSADYEAAKQILQRTTKFDPANAQAFFELGNAHWMLGEGSEAADAWSKALQIDPALRALRRPWDPEV